MSRIAHALDASATEAAWRGLEQQLDELLRLTQSSPAVADFHSAMLSRAAQAVGARAAYLWVSSKNLLPVPLDNETPASNAAWQVASFWGDDSLVSAHRDQATIDMHARNVERQRSDDGNTADSKVVHCDTVVAFIGDGSTETAKTALTMIRVEGQSVAAIEMLWLTPVTATVQRNIANILTAFAEVAADFYRNRQLRDLHHQVEMDRAIDDFAVGLQSMSHERAIWFTIVNEMGRLIPSDRVSLLIKRRGWRVGIVNHLDTVDRRSAVVRSLERLATSLNESHSIWLQSTSQVDSLPAAARWHDYLEESAARSIAFLPLLDRRTERKEQASFEIAGAIVVERFHEQPFTTEEQSQISRLTRHAAAALGRAADLRRRSVLGMFQNKATLFGILIAAILFGVAWIPVDFEIAARGELQPRSRQQVFAPTDGLVRQLHVRDGQRVAKDAVLLELSNDQLDFEMTRLSGELKTARQQLVTVQAARLEGATATAAREQRGQLAAEEERLKQVIHGLEKQHEHLLRQQEELKVRSPLAGLIVTADLEQALRSRPLRRGQRVLTVADDSGPWELELYVGDQDAGHVLAAQKATDPLPLRFVVATSPTVTHHGVVANVSQWTVLTAEGRPAVRVQAELENAAGLAARPGATVTAKIFCGRRCLGYVWLRDVFELVRTHVLF